MVCWLPWSVSGCSLASWRVLTVCSRMDCIRGPHCSHRPLATLHHRVGGAVPVGEDAGVQQVDAGGAGLVGQVYQAHPVNQGVGDLLQQAGHQVGVGVYDDDGVVVAALGLLPHLVG